MPIGENSGTDFPFIGEGNFSGHEKYRKLSQIYQKKDFKRKYQS